MLYKGRRNICIVCLAIFCSILFINDGSCLAYQNNRKSRATKNLVKINQESQWLSVDLPQQERMLIDQVIADNYQQVKVLQQQLQKQQPIKDINNLMEFNILVSYMNKMSDIQKNMHDEIIKILPTEQREIFESHQQQKKEIAERATATLLTLKLTPEQQAKIINLLLKEKKKSWSILANTSISWEERIKRMERADVAKQIHALLDTKQQGTWMYFNVLALQGGAPEGMVPPR